MSAPEGFEVRLGLASPVALGALPYAPTLDSVLLALLSGGETLVGDDAKRLYEQLGEILVVENGIPAASCLWPDEAQQTAGITSTHPRVASVEEVRQWASGVYGDTIVPDNPEKNRSTTASGPFTARMHTVRAVYAGTWNWWGVGDRGRVEELLTGTALSVGARRGSGYGLVSDVALRRSDETAWRLLGLGPYVLGRPIPARGLERFLAESEISHDELNAERHCAVPLPAWPAPTWGPGPHEVYWLPMLEDADQQLEGLV